MLIRPGLRPYVPGWRQRDAYSRDEPTGSQLCVLPHCYEGSVTGVTDAIQRRGGADSRVFCPTINLDRAKAYKGFVSGVGEAFQADERAGCQQIGEGAAIGQAQILRGQFGEGIEHERAFLNLVMRDFEPRLVDQSIAE